MVTGDAWSSEDALELELERETEGDWSSEDAPETEGDWSRAARRRRCSSRISCSGRATMVRCALVLESVEDVVDSFFVMAACFLPGTDGLAPADGDG